MAADPILYCLERLTDYRDFERLASDIMVGVGYANLEPIGGSSDGGRDALHISRDDGRTTIFAYSARADWETKFKGDCKRIQQLDKAPDEVVFVSTREIGAQKKDSLRASTHRKYGWDVDFYDCERLRAQLVGPQTALLAQHPAIFVPPWFERRGGELVGHELLDLVVIDHLASDHAAATWLSRKLTSLGWATWCFGQAPLAGEDADETVRLLIAQRAASYLPILSIKSITDANLRARSVLASAKEGRVLPCWLDDLSATDMDAAQKKLTPARFDSSWADGLYEVQRQLDHRGVKKTLDTDLGEQLALTAFQNEPLLVDKPETLFTNVFPVTVPANILAYELKNENATIDPQLFESWAHHRRGRWIFSFSEPPKPLPTINKRPHKYDWREHPKQYRADSVDMVKILVKRVLFVACREAGFQWCDERYCFYLDESDPKRHGYQHVDGSYTSVAFTGRRSWGGGEFKTHFKYQLGPIFRVAVDEQGNVSVLVRIYVRVTDAERKPIETAKIPSRRKRVTKSWWNRQWLQRTIGLMQFIAGEIADIDGEIVVGEGDSRASIKVKPLNWDCPVSIDAEALDRIGDFGEEIAGARQVIVQQPDGSIDV